MKIIFLLKIIFSIQQFKSWNYDMPNDTLKLRLLQNTTKIMQKILFGKTY